MINEIKITLQNFFEQKFWITSLSIWEDTLSCYKFSLEYSRPHNMAGCISGMVVDSFIYFDQDGYKKYETELSKLLKLTAFL
jgi:hypothetical protein